jgi:hypothetical protein
MKLLNRIASLALLCVSIAAHAQTWNITAAVTPSIASPGATVTATATYTPSAAASNITLDLELHDPSGNKITQTWVPAQNFTAGQALTETLTYTLPATAANGVYTYGVGTFVGTSLTPSTWMNNAAPFTVSPPVATTVPPPAPPCLPKVQYPPNVDYGLLPAGVSTTSDYYAVYVCTLPAGLITYGYIGLRSADAVQILNAMAGQYSLTQATTDLTAAGRLPTASELAFLNTKLAVDRPRALVAFAGAALTRSVYGLNADGTLNPTATGELVPVATPCDETTRIASSPSYYSVSGQKDSTGATIAAGLYALCTVSLPIGSN